jgi:hypothetical protein
MFQTKVQRAGWQVRFFVRERKAPRVMSLKSTLRAAAQERQVVRVGVIALALLMRCFNPGQASQRALDGGRSSILLPRSPLMSISRADLRLVNTL